MFFVGKGEKERVRMPCFARRKKSELACSLEIFGRKKKLTNLTTAAIGLRKKKHHSLVRSRSPPLEEGNPLENCHKLMPEVSSSCGKSCAKQGAPGTCAGKPGGISAASDKRWCFRSLSRSISGRVSFFPPLTKPSRASLSLSLSLLSFDDRDGVITCEAPIRVSLCIQGLSGCGELV